jgi:FkbM family methyltransferase
MHLLPLSLRRKIRLMAWQRLNLRWTLESGITLEIKSPADWEAYNEIFVSAEYDSAILSALHRCGSEAKQFTVLDVGSNFGFFSLRVLHLAKSQGINEQLLDFTMVEGSRRVLEEAKHRLSHRILTDHNARIIHGLAGNKTGSALLYESDMHLFNSIVDQRGTGTSVPFVDLEACFADRERIDLLKCDIQGAEERFLESSPLLLGKTTVAVFELHHFLCNTTRCLEILKAGGFSSFTTLRQNEAISVIQCER